MEVVQIEKFPVYSWIVVLVHMDGGSGSYVLEGPGAL
jgi:hypothetical protein